MKTFDFNKVKMIVTDLDGTLFMPNGKPSAFTINILQQLHDKGIIIVINSGRPLGSIDITCKDIPYDWAIGMNGQMIKNKHTNEIIVNKALNKEDIFKIYGIAQKYHVVCNLHDDKCSIAVFSKRDILFGIAYNLLEQFRWIGKQKKGFKKAYYLDIKKCGIETIGKICFAGPKKHISRLTNELDHVFPQYKCFRVSPNWLEVLDGSISKGNGLKQVLKKENINANECIGFGDGENDIELLQACGYSCAMKNGMEKTKENANEIIEANIDDGLAHFLQEYLLKK